MSVTIESSMDIIEMSGCTSLVGASHVCSTVSTTSATISLMNSLLVGQVVLWRLVLTLRVGLMMMNLLLLKILVVERY